MMGSVLFDSRRNHAFESQWCLMMVPPDTHRYRVPAARNLIEERQTQQNIVTCGLFKVLRWSIKVYEFVILVLYAV